MAKKTTAKPKKPVKQAKPKAQSAEASEQPKKRSPLNAISRFFAFLLIIILLLIVGTVGYYAAANYRVEHRLDKEYSTIKWPSVLQLDNKHYEGYSFQTWTKGSAKQPYVYAYGYKVAPGYTLQQVNDLMATSFQKAGYSLVKYTYPTPISLTATHDKFTVYVTLESLEDGSVDPNDPNSPAVKIGVSIDEQR